MKIAKVYSIVLQALLLQSADATACKKRGSCNADNCARAATGTVDGKQSLRTASCSSFQQCTVIPATSTLTSIVTVTPADVTQLVTVTTVTSVQVIPTTVTAGGSGPQKRGELYANIKVLDKRALSSVATPATTVCPTSVPSTASACSGTVRYASACSCAGITKSYTTLTAPSTTVTVTSVLDPVTETIPVAASTVVTSFAVTTVNPVGPAPSNFQVQMLFGSDSAAGAAQYANLFVSMDNGFGELSARPQSSGLKFTINSAGELVNEGSTSGPQDHVVVAVTNQAGHAVLVWDTRQHYQASGVSFPFAHCTSAPSTSSPGSYQLQCNAGGGTTFAVCDSGQWNTFGGARTRTDAFLVSFNPGQTHAGCYPFEALMVATS